MIRHFSKHLEKLALTMKGPPIPRSFRGIRSRSGAGLRLPKLPKPAVRTMKPVGAVDSVPVASGKNLGTTVLPRPKTVPNPRYGGSLVR